MFDTIKKFFQEYFGGNTASGTVRLIFDLLIIAGILIGFFYLIRQRINIGRLIVVLGGCLLLFFLSLLFNLSILTVFMKYVFGWIAGFFIIIYSGDIRLALEGKPRKDRRGNLFISEKEKEEAVSVICNTVDYLSKRKIGALITFERKDSLDNLISKAIPINSFITQELLTTIFTPGTACHDGGVIIRSGRIACAGAYYPLSDNYNVPKFLGTRHRAAIGISEHYDAVTIVVSEETGNISVTVGGNINLELTVERIGVLLDGYLGVK